MILLAVLLLAAPQPVAERVVLVDDTINVPASERRALAVELKQQPAIVECAYNVVRGSAVRVALYPREAPAQAILASPLGKSGGFRYPPQPGAYSLVIDNRAGTAPADVRLRVSVLFARAHVRELSAARRFVVVALALAFCAAAAYFVGLPLMRTLRRGHGSQTE